MNDDVLRIYAGRPAGAAGPKRPVRAMGSSSGAAPGSHTAPRASEPTIVDQLRAVIERPAAFGESVKEEFDRKERELAGLFRALGLGDARSLLARLADPVAGDPAGDAFARLAADRRRRLLSVLDHAARGHLASHDRSAS